MGCISLFSGCAGLELGLRGPFWHCLFGKNCMKTFAAQNSISSYVNVFPSMFGSASQPLLESLAKMDSLQTVRTVGVNQIRPYWGQSDAVTFVIP